MRILLLSEGDAETQDSWSGCTTSLLQQLRAAGHRVYTGDVDLYGRDRWLAAARSFAPDRRRWAARYHLGPAGFARRSVNAARHVAAHRGRIDVVLQTGATFAPVGHGDVPYFVYCDSHIGWARLGQDSGFSDAVALRPPELDRIHQREREIYHGAAMVFTFSGRLRDSFVSDFGVPDDRVRAVYAGPNCDPERIPPRRPRPEGRPPTVLFVGRQFDRKGGPVLLRAFRRLRERIPEAELVVIGPDSLGVEEPGVRCLGFISKDRPNGWEEIAAAYAAADVFCLPTRFEPFGVVFVEAMYFGLPCVGPQAWAVPEIIRDGETGFTVPVDDEIALAERLTLLLRDPALAARMGDAGRERARALFSWSGVARAMTAAMEPLVAVPAHA